jgi:hypothetical protein
VCTTKVVPSFLRPLNQLRLKNKLNCLEVTPNSCFNNAISWQECIRDFKKSVLTNVKNLEELNVRAIAKEAEKYYRRRRLYEGVRFSTTTTNCTTVDPTSVVAGVNNEGRRQP